MDTEEKISGQVGEWSEYLQEYFKIHLQLLQYEFGEQLFIIASVLLSRLVSIFILMLSIVFGSGALAFYLEHLIGSLPLSFFLVGLGYGVIGWIIYRIRKPFFAKLTLSFLLKSVFNERNINLKSMQDYPDEYGKFLATKENIRLKKIQMDELVHNELLRVLHELTDVERIKNWVIPFVLTNINQLKGFLKTTMKFIPAVRDGAKISIPRILFDFLGSIVFRKKVSTEAQKYPLYINE